MSTLPGPSTPDAGTEGAAPLRVAVCALTCLRPHGLEKMLRGIGAQVFRDTPPDVRVIIVDNDAAGSGEATVEALRPGFAFPLEYVVETTRGIPFGRNRALREAGDVDFVAFIDDDEVPAPDWLEQILAAQRVSGAEIVTGPVFPIFEEEPPAWVREGRFFDRRRHHDGELIHYARTSNVLIAASVWGDDGHPFPESFSNNGGDDTYFFKRAYLAGNRISWSDRAVVDEYVPPSRVDVRWLMRREYRRGNTLSLCLRALEDTPLRRARRAGQGVFRIVQGVLILASGAVRGRAAAVQGLQRIWFGGGLISGLTGHVYQEYSTIHGS